MDFAHILRALMSLYVALGLFWLFSAFNDKYRNTAVLTTGIFAGGLVIGRLLSLLADGQPSPIMLVYIAMELGLIPVPCSCSGCPTKAGSHSSETGSFFPRQSEAPPNRSNHSFIVLPGKWCLSRSLRVEVARLKQDQIVATHEVHGSENTVFRFQKVAGDTRCLFQMPRLRSPRRSCVARRSRFFRRHPIVRPVFVE